MFMSTTGEFGPSQLKRRLPGGKGGDLAAAEAGWPHLAEVTRQARAFAAAMRDKDVATLSALTGRGYQAEQLVSDEGAALFQLTKGAGEPVIFTDRNAASDEAAGEACWCTRKTCAKRWPIDSRDADNQPGRPYACLRVEGALRDGQWRYRLDASHDVAGLQEP